MPIPSNTTFLTATDLGTITTTPTLVTQQVDFSGTTYTVYYSGTATIAGEYSVFAFGDLTTYKPTVTIYMGPASAPDQVVTGGGPPLNGQNIPVQFPVTTPGVLLFVVTTNGGNPAPANLTLSVVLHNTHAIPAGSIAVPDDTGFLPWAVVSATADYVGLKYFLGFPSGEAGDVLSTGTALAQGIDNLLHVFNGAFQEIATAALISAGNQLTIRTCLTPQLWYVGLSGLGIANSKFYTMTAVGVLSVPTTLTGITTLNAIAASNNQATLYFAKAGTGQAVQTWNIAGAAVGPDLVAGVAGYLITSILVLGDNTIIVAYYKSTVTRDLTVKAFDATGTLLHTYVMDVPGLVTQPRLAYAIDDPNSFWVWNHPASTPGISKFSNVKVSDGSILTTRAHVEFEIGQYQPPATATPTASFGISFSCPFWITRVAQTATQTFTIRRQRRFLLPSSPDNKTIQMPTLELLMRTGIGLTPGAASDPPVLGSDPTVMMRLSKDGGNTYFPERGRSAGVQGRYKDRVRWLRATGNYRNAVLELTVSDPVDWQWIAVLGDPQEGTS